MSNGRKTETKMCGGGGGWGERVEGGIRWHMTDGKTHWTEFELIGWSKVKSTPPGGMVVITYTK